MTTEQEKAQTGGSGLDANPTPPPVEIRPLRSSPEIDKLAAALAKAQGEMKHPKKNRTATVPLKTGGSYSYNYSDLADVLDAIRVPFSKHGLALVQIPYSYARCVQGAEKAHDMFGVGVVTRVMHESGQWLEGTLELPTQDDRPQTAGSAITYARRYMASPMSGVASEEDDDGSIAQGNDGRAAPRDRPQAQVSRDQAEPQWKRALAAFIPYGLTKEHLETFRNGATMEKFSDADFEALRELAAALKDGSVKAEHVRGTPKAAPAAASTRKGKLDAAFGGGTR